MTLYAYKQRYYRARRMALKELEKKNILAFKIDNEFGDIIAIDKLAHARIIKICLQEEKLPKIKKPGNNIPLEIWVRKKGEKDFQIISF